MSEGVAVYHPRVMASSGSRNRLRKGWLQILSRLFLPCVGLLLISMVTPAEGIEVKDDAWKLKLYPEHERASLDPARSYALIVMVDGERVPDFEASLRQLSRPLAATTLEQAWIRLLRGYDVSARGPNLKKLLELPRVRSVWVIDEDLGEQYGAILRGMAYAIENLPSGSGANMSLGPRVGRRGTVLDLMEPVHQLTALALEKGITFVFSAGNEGPEENTLNPWGLADWAISVGAADSEGKKLWEGSSRGVRGDSRLRPTLVAPGIDVIVIHSEDGEKSAQQIAAEEQANFRQRVAPELWGQRTVATGTSTAAAEVSRCVALLLHFLYEEVRSRLEAKAQMVLELGFPKDHVLSRDRLIGSIQEQGEYLVVTYPLDKPDPRLIKQLLMDVAQPMPGYEAHEVGAGFISYGIVLQHFGKHGDPGAQIMVVKSVNG